MEKDIVIGLGEIGIPILKIISRTIKTAGYDINQNLMDKKKYDNLLNHKDYICTYLYTIYKQIC